METKEIPREEWESYLDMFSHDHEGEHINIETEGANVGSQISVKDAILVGISDDRKASEGERIEIVASESPDVHITRVVPRPSHMRMAWEDRGAPVALQIESDDGSMTLVRFVA